MVTQNRVKSKVAWIAVGSFALLIGDMFGLWAKLGITNDAARAAIDGLLAIGTAFGIWNDPTNSRAF